ERFKGPGVTTSSCRTGFYCPSVNSRVTNREISDRLFVPPVKVTMAEANEPKKETVRITLPPRRGDAAEREEDDTVRINLPSRPPTSEPPPPTAAPLLPRPGTVPIPRPPVAQNPLPTPPVGGVPAPRTVLPPPPPPPATKTPLPRPSGTTAGASAPRPTAATTPLTKET